MTAPARVALVTGAAGGIGRATVDALMRGGFAVAAVNLALADVPCAFDAPFEAVSADVTDEAAVAKRRLRFGPPRRANRGTSG